MDKLYDEDAPICHTPDAESTRYMDVKTSYTTCPLCFGLISLGQKAISELQIHPPSDAEVTAVMVQNNTRSFRVQQVVAYNVTKERVDPSVPGAPAHITEVSVPHYHSASNGQVPLVIRKDQWVVVKVEVEPKGSSGDVLQGTVEVSGTGWAPLQRQLRATVK